MNQKLAGPRQIQLLDFELADGDRSAKMVFQSKVNGQVATFETGSFLSRTSTGAPRHDICVSTAGGCTRRCTFCATVDSPLGFERLLSWEEIVHQVDVAVRRHVDADIDSHVVGFMGNGEPPDNPACERAVHEMMDRSYRIERIAISTIGENTRQLARYSTAFAHRQELPAPIILHFSLHVADDDKRRLIIPGRKKLQEILRFLDDYSAAAYHPEHNPLPVHLNVVLMENPSAGFSNATLEDADRLAEFFHAPSSVTGACAHRQLKLSAYNAVPGKPFVAPSVEVRSAFAERLKQRGVSFYTFRGGGIEIDENNARGGFACGQLRATTANVLRTQTGR